MSTFLGNADIKTPKECVKAMIKLAICKPKINNDKMFRLATLFAVFFFLRDKQKFNKSLSNVKSV